VLPPGQHAGLKSGIAPRIHDEAKAAHWADLFGPFGGLAVVLGGEQTLFDRQLPHRDFENLEIAGFISHWRVGLYSDIVRRPQRDLVPCLGAQ